MEKTQCSAQSRFAEVALALLVVFVVAGSAQGQTYSVLYSFTGGVDGAFPDASLVQDAQGNLYGTTRGGGVGPCFGGAGCGTVFKVNTAGNETVLHSFLGASSDGERPLAGLVLDAQGVLYGTTALGGAHNGGIAFKLDTTGKETVLHSFGETTEDGIYPYASFVQDVAGNLYSTTYYGGALPAFSGTVFKLDPSGNQTILYGFTGTPDGTHPRANLIRDTQGNLYGSTNWGGDLTCNAPTGCGTIFKLDASGAETILYSFTGIPDGAFPYAGLAQDADGNLYGTTQEGGSFGYGTVFKIDTTGKETVLYSFCSQPKCADGGSPYAGVVLDAQGNLYGTTWGGHGTVFRIDTTGKETILHSFNGTDGANPYAALIRDAAGNLYGTTENGGATGSGVVFKIAAGTSVSLGFPVKQCGKKVVCTPKTAPMTAVVDHARKVAYECGGGGWGTVMAFTAQSASIADTSDSFGCKKTPKKSPKPLYGYTNPNVSSFVQGYGYTGGNTLYYDGHPGFDYGFGYGTPLIPSVTGCVTYLDDAENVTATNGHILAIIPQPTQPPNGCQNAGNASGYQIVYMHLASYYDKSTGEVWVRCVNGHPSGFCVKGQTITVPCPTCAQQNDWISTDRIAPIGYSGNFLADPAHPSGWGRVPAHLHFEVDSLALGPPMGVDPYGWCGTPETDPYTTFTGLANVTMWSGFQLICP